MLRHAHEEQQMTRTHRRGIVAPMCLSSSPPATPPLTHLESDHDRREVIKEKYAGEPSLQALNVSHTNVTQLFACMYHIPMSPNSSPESIPY